MIIEPVEGELGRYFVTSESDPDQRYLVDLMENPKADGCSGRCGCKDWETRRQPLVNKSETVSEEHFCKHLICAQRKFARDMALAIHNDREKRQGPQPGGA